MGTQNSTIATNVGAWEINNLKGKLWLCRASRDFKVGDYDRRFAELRLPHTIPSTGSLSIVVNQP